MNAGDEWLFVEWFIITVFMCFLDGSFNGLNSALQQLLS